MAETAQKVPSGGWQGASLTLLCADDDEFTGTSTEKITASLSAHFRGGFGPGNKGVTAEAYGLPEADPS